MVVGEEPATTTNRNLKMKTSKRLQPWHGDQLICRLMEYSAEGDPAATNCLDTLEECPETTDDHLVAMYNTTDGRLHTL
jgi:hypothetical protein